MERKSRIVVVAAMTGVALGAGGAALASGVSLPTQTPRLSTPGLSTPNVASPKVSTPTEHVSTGLPAIDMPATAWADLGRFGRQETPSRTPAVTVDRAVQAVTVGTVAVGAKTVAPVVFRPITMPAQASASSSGATASSRDAAASADSDPAVAGRVGPAWFGAEANS